MSRMRTFFSIMLPSALAGGVLFGSAFSRADAGLQVGFVPDDPSAGAVVAQADPQPDPQPRPHPHPHPNPNPMPMVPPVPPVPPIPPVPPVPMITPDMLQNMQQEVQHAIDQVR